MSSLVTYNSMQFTINKLKVKMRTLHVSVTKSAITLAQWHMSPFAGVWHGVKGQSPGKRSWGEKAFLYTDTQILMFQKAKMHNIQTSNERNETCHILVPNELRNAKLLTVKLGLK